MFDTCGTCVTSNIEWKIGSLERHIDDRILRRRHGLREFARPLLPRGVSPEVVHPHEAALLRYSLRRDASASDRPMVPTSEAIR